MKNKLRKNSFDLVFRDDSNDNDLPHHTSKFQCLFFPIPMRKHKKKIYNESSKAKNCAVSSRTDLSILALKLNRTSDQTTERDVTQNKWWIKKKKKRKTTTTTTIEHTITHTLRVLRITSDGYTTRVRCRPAAARRVQRRTYVYLRNRCMYRASKMQRRRVTTTTTTTMTTTSTQSRAEQQQQRRWRRQ